MEGDPTMSLVELNMALQDSTPTMFLENNCKNNDSAKAIESLCTFKGVTKCSMYLSSSTCI